MRGDVVFRIYGCHEGRERDFGFGTYRTEEEGRRSQSFKLGR